MSESEIDTWSPWTVRQGSQLSRTAMALSGDGASSIAGAFVCDRHGRPLPIRRVNDPQVVRWSPTAAVLHAAYPGWGTVATKVVVVPPDSPLDATGPRPCPRASWFCEVAFLRVLGDRQRTREQIPAGQDCGDRPGGWGR